MFIRFLILSLLVFCFYTSFSQVVINEYSCSNKDDYLDNFGEYEDWVELYNSGPTTVDISGYFLTDKNNRRTKWAFPSGTNISPGDHIRVFASSRDTVLNNVIHTNFKLTQMKQEYIILSSPIDTSVVDSIWFETPTQRNHSKGRSTDGATTWKIFENPTPNSSNNSSFGYDTYSLKPSFDVSPGFYTATVTLNLSSSQPGVTIRYTTDGSEPTSGSALYTSPLTINSTTIVRAKCYSSNPNLYPSFTESNTYFINENHTFPVVSVASDDFNNLFGGAPEIMSSFEFYDESKQFQFEMEGDFRGHGNDSWAFSQKGIRFYTRDQYGYANKIDHKIFPTSPRTDFDVLILRNAGSDNYPGGSGFFGRPTCHVRDGYIQTLADKHDLNVDTRRYKPCIVYLNGQYWGIYEMRERIDSDYTDYYYGQEEKWLDMLEYWGGLDVRYGDPLATDWNNLYTYMTTNNLANTNAYNNVLAEIDEMSFLDYFILNTHIVNTDWLNWNTKWWRGVDSPSPTGWRYTFWDMDNVFNLGQNYTGVTNTSYMNDPCDPQSLFTGNPNIPHMDMVNALLDNPTFYDLYINRYADLINTTLNCDTMLSLFDSMIADLAVEMPQQISRWGGTLTDWNNNVQFLRDEIVGRCAVIDSLLIKCYQPDIGPKESLVINVYPPAAGYVKVNTIYPNAYPWYGEYFTNVNVSFQAFENSGYVFDHWELLNHSPNPSTSSDSIYFNLTTTDSIVAVFQLTLSLSGTAIDDTCSLSKGSIALNITGGTAPFSFQWSNNDTTQNISGLLAGNYTVTITDGANNSQTQSFVIQDNPPPTASSTTINDDCFGSATGSVDVTVTGGSVPYTYAWSNGFSTEDILSLPSGNFSLTITDASGCMITESAIVNQNAYPDVQTSIQQISCYGGDDGAIDVTTTGGITPYLYAWDVGLGNSEDVTNLSEGIYLLTVTDASGCTVEISSSVVSPAPISLTLDVEYASNGNDGEIETFVSGGVSPYTYLWNDPLAQTSAIAVGLEPGTYQVTVTDSNGCQNSEEGLVELGSLKCIKTIMTFTPNDDAVNDTWEIDCLFGMPHKIFVYNRWGQVVFESENYDGSWDGMVNGVPLPDGGYFYTIEVIHTNNKEYLLQGALNIIR
ncbi:MAG: CotH kinase family protein [Saprospiraceae bacterium]|nr:CotH kinase family protein [Saprospiraceae bacterium]